MKPEQIVSNLIQLLRRSAGEQGVNIEEDECLIVADALTALKERAEAAEEAMQATYDDAAGEDL